MLNVMKTYEMKTLQNPNQKFTRKCQTKKTGFMSETLHKNFLLVTQ